MRDFLTRLYLPDQRTGQQSGPPRWLLCIGVVVCTCAIAWLLAQITGTVSQGVNLADVIVGSLLALVFGLVVVAVWSERRWHRAIVAVMVLITLLGIDQAMQL